VGFAAGRERRFNLSAPCLGRDLSEPPVMGVKWSPSCLMIVRVRHQEHASPCQTVAALQILPIEPGSRRYYSDLMTTVRLIEAESRRDQKRCQLSSSLGIRRPPL
jgi:hypothetical protein